MSKRLQVRIPHPGVWTDFENFVKGKYGHTYATLALEVEQALIDKMVTEGYGIYKEYQKPENKSTISNPQKIGHIHIIKKNPKIFCRYLYENYPNNAEISFRKLRDIIIEQTGRTHLDTHRSYVDSLQALNILRPLFIENDRYKNYKFIKKNIPESLIFEFKQYALEGG
ncbi:hypothetical protein [Methanobacterium paludis]|uniref:Uncharacterized protein n=1 Tax=Methanobacterium paludis (strain DSM 25820 / JCM 18151 / SWAN1) TaxID=868131 RepID=F6D3A5_METPW|nr:hypothetical protein [Methanobacterium paludis]AEG18697.1 hypothetical protein MSWAN_1686 [Methanobacterium paludis]